MKKNTRRRKKGLSPCDKPFFYAMLFSVRPWPGVLV